MFGSWFLNNDGQSLCYAIFQNGKIRSLSLLLIIKSLFQFQYLKLYLRGNNCLILLWKREEQYQYSYMDGCLLLLHVISLDIS